MQGPKKSDPSDKKTKQGVKSARLLEEAPPLPKRFFAFAQEGIAMLWLDDSRKKAERRPPSHK
jgi:hypothetical protein